MLPDPFPVPPWTSPCSGEVNLPGSKSLTNRALVLAALGRGTTSLHGALFSRDTRILVDSLAALGFAVRENPAAAAIQVVGADGRIPARAARLFVGNAGTAARFLTALVCLHPDGCFEFDGDPEMRRRPMRGLIETLQGLGARFSFAGEPFCFPFSISTCGLRGGLWQVDAAASSQMLSALMMAAPFAAAEVRLLASGARPAFVEMTAGLMRQFGARIEGAPDSGYIIPGGQTCQPVQTAFPIEPDATAASYFLMLPLVVGGSLRLPGMRAGMLQGDTAFAAVLQDIGLHIREEGGAWTVSRAGPVSPHHRIYSFERFSDTFLTLAAAAPLLPCPVTLTGIGHTRLQECDRIAVMAAELARTGARTTQTADSLSVSPFPQGLPNPSTPVVIQTHKDHRVAMSFAVLGCSNRTGCRAPWLHIADPGCCAKTFPGFFGELGRLYRYCHD